MLKLRKILLCDNIYRVTALIVLIISLAVTLLPNYKSNFESSKTDFEGILTEYKIDGNSLTMTIDCEELLIGKYYFKTQEEMNNYQNALELGIKLKLKGTLKEPKNNTVPNLFNYKKYLYNKKIYYILNIENIKITNKNKSFLYKIKSYAYKRVEKIKNNEYLYAYILGKTNKIESDVINSYRTNGISHLFALSGLHVSIFSMILMFILKKLKTPELARYISVFLFLIIFAFITGFSPSILRASLLFFLIGINKVYYFNIKTINILYLVFIILALINPFIIYNMSFILSFTTTYFIILASDLVNDKNYLKGLLKVSTISFISNIGLSLYYFGKINPVGILLNLLFVPFVSFIVFPISLITFILPIFSVLLELLSNIMEFFSLILSNLSFDIYFPKISIIETIFYYILLVLFLTIKKKKVLFIMILFLLLIKIKPLMNSNTMCYFIDVGQGDSTLIITPHKKEVLLIDTGGRMKYKKEKWKETSKTYSLGLDTLIPFLRSLGINKIDYMFLTHGDYDHAGEALNIINNFKVDKVYINNGVENSLEKKIKNKEKLTSDYLEIDNIKIYSLNNKIFNNENDDSLVLYLYIDNFKLLLMGDASVKTEKEILNNYNLNQVDILKVGHHGSKTSSSEEFIDIINPKYSIISSGENNKFGHPNKEVLERLEESIIYRTDINGTIMFKLKKDKYYINKWAP